MRIPVKTNTKPYEILLENGALSKASEFFNLQRKVLIVTDSGVPAEYARTIASQCAEPVLLTIPAGEASKNFITFETLLSAMLHASFTRKDCVVSVGGGVVGDVSGFVASCYMRGVDFYNVPTTLLSEVDSSIGGKTAIDLEGVKNAVGTFHHPSGVLIDPTTLQTLDKRLLSAGLAESIKMALTSDAALFDLLESSRDLSTDLNTIIEASIRIKKQVVEEDPTETGLRRVLNFGHTVGHAIESAYGGKLLHGECVALGMIPMCSPAVQKRLLAVLNKYHLPTRIDKSPDEILPFLTHDKKLANGLLTAVWVESPGNFVFRQMKPEDFRRSLEILL